MHDDTPPPDVERARSGDAKPTHPDLLHAEPTEAGYRLHLRVPENLYYFDGHFPHVAIVPGVCVLKWVIDYIETYSGAPLQMVTMEAVKFHRPLLSRQQFSIEFSYDRQTTAWHYDVVANDKPCASGRFIVQP